MVRALMGDSSGGVDLQVDYDGLERFAGELDDLRGQWDGTRPSLDPTAGLGGAADLTTAVDDFTREWGAAAKAIDSFMTALSGMCRTAVQAYTATDQHLAGGPPAQAHHGRDYAF
ncbi:MAG: hypothetical protein HOW97_43540 [Catenulispora sp.]|nr:hypothetical protein [Catenulispora sp.]